MKSAHDMPFGAALTPAGPRFAIWAPSANAAEVSARHGGKITTHTDLDDFLNDPNLHAVSIDGQYGEHDVVVMTMDWPDLRERSSMASPPFAFCSQGKFRGKC